MKVWPALIAGCAMAAFGAVCRGQDAPAGSLTGKKEVERLEARVKELEESLTLARAETGFFRDQWVELRLRNEALGLEALTGDERATQEKLVRVVGELYRGEKSLRALQGAAGRLIAAADALYKAKPAEFPLKRAEYEAAMRETRDVLAGKGEAVTQVAPDLGSGRIVSVDESLQVAVLNFGEGQGVRVGMPFRILRGDLVIGRCKVLEVRESLSSALITEVAKKENVQAGDRLLLETTK
jgi:hypothetical protein